MGRRLLAAVEIAGLMLSACATAAEQPGAVVPAELLARAAADGAVRVIVRFRVAPAPEDARAQAIEAGRRALLSEIAQTPHRVLRTYETLPFLALEASGETLRVLASSPNVLAIQADTLAAPHSRPAAPQRTQ